MSGPARGFREEPESLEGCGLSRAALPATGRLLVFTQSPEAAGGAAPGCIPTFSAPQRAVEVFLVPASLPHKGSHRWNSPWGGLGEGEEAAAGPATWSLLGPPGRVQMCV